MSKKIVPIKVPIVANCKDICLQNKVNLVYKIQVNAIHTLLTHSHTKTPFDAPGKQSFRKHCGKRRN